MSPAIIISIALGILVVSLSILLIIDRNRNANLFKLFTALQESYDEMHSAFQNLLTEQHIREIEKSDGFLKFVSDSREWAFNYIEDVQSKLVKFDNEMNSIVEYYSVFGPENQGIHIDLLKQVSEAYAELKNALPKEEDKV
jgi:hypothetical protein